MRYPKDHKTNTRERILGAAAPLFRKHGIDGVSVDSLMEAANLTRGGFYAHFKSKEALVVAIMRRDAGLVQMMKDRDGPSSADLNSQGMQILSKYLAPKNRSEIVRGCPLASMPIDAARGTKGIRAAYGARLWELIRQLRRGLGRSRKAESDAIVAAVLTLGGVLLSRACDSKEDADRIEEACLDHVRRLVGKFEP